MGDFDDEFIHQLRNSSWPLYSVGMVLIVLRLYARIRRLGIRQLQPDDYLMVLAAGLFTALIVCLNTICQGGGSNLFPPEDFVTFTQEEINERIYGSKIVVISEQAMLNLIYTIKVCMLILYTRLTLGLQQQKVVRYLAVYVGCGWLASEITFFTACRPFQGYWGMPPPDPQCTTLQYYALVQGCFNISSDILMLCIPIPLVVKLKIPLKQKMVLIFIFSLGAFVIVAALLTKIFNLSDVWDPSYMLWYVREASVAVYVANLPMIWPLIREWLPFFQHIGSTIGNATAAGTKQRAKLRKGSNMLDSKASQIKMKISGPKPLAYISHPSRQPSLASLNPTEYDLEMGMKPGLPEDFVSQDFGIGLGITNVVRKADKQERVVVGNFGFERTVMKDVHPGGISVERTVVVQEEIIDVDKPNDMSEDEQTRLYDWELQGGPRQSLETEGGMKRSASRSVMRTASRSVSRSASRNGKM
ncbi:hypothetical protein BJ170DRAFT_143117 [Xylariales sp. AK1849]|nr:hypothetical protein BJ170DRAFT_143117 [Xylariales sp. AK1849]